jgi:hypothetical protein
MRRRPANLVVIGDALAASTPLRAGRERGGAPSRGARRVLATTELARVPDAYFAAARRIVDDPWMLATLTDLIYPGVSGRRPPGARRLQWYLRRVLALTGAHERLPPISRRRA